MLNSRTDRSAARRVRPVRLALPASRSAKRWPEEAPQHLHGAARRAALLCARRADDRRGPGGAPPDMGRTAAPPREPRDTFHDALHGRSGPTRWSALIRSIIECRSDRLPILPIQMECICLDRKAIITMGQLRCAGRSLFLKTRFGLGYTLTYHSFIKFVLSFVIANVY